LQGLQPGYQKKPEVENSNQICFNIAKFNKKIKGDQHMELHIESTTEEFVVHVISKNKPPESSVEIVIRSIDDKFYLRRDIDFRPPDTDIDFWQTDLSLQCTEKFAPGEYAVEAVCAKKYVIKHTRI